MYDPNLYPPEACFDSDEDGFSDDIDNCPNEPNSDQSDPDSDIVGDVCDNCLNVHNLDQEDKPGEGKGDICDFCPILMIFSETAEEVQLLRDFRDKVLKQTPEGRKLIEIYYE